jgi:hypothetical protein
MIQMINKFRSLPRQAFASLLVLATLGTSCPAQTTSVSAPKRLPPDVVAYISVPNASELKKRFNASQMGLLIADPAMADFVADVKMAIANASKESEAQGGINIESLLAIPDGNITIAGLAGGPKGLGYVVMLDFGKNRSTVDKLIAKMAEGLANEGAKKTQVEVGDFSITNFKLPVPPANPNTPGAAPPRSLTNLGWFIDGSMLVVGNGTDTLKGVIARWDGKHSSTFGDNPVYRYIAEKGASDGPAPIAEWYLDPIALVTGMINGVDPNNFQAQLILGFLPTLGLDKIKAIGGTINMGTPKYEEISRTVIYVDPPRTGALDLLKFPATSQSPPKWVPANATSYMSLNWDLQAAWRGIGTLVDSFNPQGPGTFENLINQLATQEGGPMIHPKKDFIDHLSGRIQFVSDATQPEQAGELPGGRMLFALGVKNVDGLKATIAKLVNTPGSPVTTRQFQGETIYELPSPAQLGNAAGGKIGISIAQGNLMIGIPETLLEQALRGDVEPLSASADYKRLATSFPAQASSIGYARQNTQLKTIYQMLRTGNLPGVAPGAGFPGGGGGLPFDLKKLPPFSVVQKYLHSSGSYIIPDKNGAVMVSFSPRKASK